MINSNAHKTNFILNIINEDLENNKNDGQIITRFPPEPNGYLHIGHAKAICLNFEIAQHYRRGPCHLRFDDTNPENESVEYVNAIQSDIQWLGYDWQQHLYFASDYFDQLFELACQLIRQGDAYVCHLSAEQVREYRGTLKQAGRNSPYRDRSVQENLDLFHRMKDGEFEEGYCTLRAKIDMASANMNMRDPALYRIKKVKHPHLNKTLNIYPMYDFTHPASDAIERITHSLCTLEFEDHRPLYDWVVKQCNFKRPPRQIEFSRLNLNYTITSKRKLRHLVERGWVDGWDDPRMPTLCGLRRRGFTPESIKSLCETVGISKQNSITDMSIFEECVRSDLNQKAPRRYAVLKPLLVTIQGLVPQTLNVPNHPQNADFGRRDITISQQIYIDQNDYMSPLPKGYKKLTQGGRIRLMNAYVIECDDVITDEQGNICELKCHYLPETLGGKKPEDGKKPAGIIHWVDANNCCEAEVRLYDRLFNIENPAACDDIEQALNPNSCQVLKHVKVEPSLLTTTAEKHFQFNRVGYFCTDLKEHDPEKNQLVFNRVVTLKDNWQQKIS